jgi:hypothetical protein
MAGALLVLMLACAELHGQANSSGSQDLPDLVICDVNIVDGTLKICNKGTATVKLHKVFVSWSEGWYTSPCWNNALRVALNPSYLRPGRSFIVNLSNRSALDPETEFMIDSKQQVRELAENNNCVDVNADIIECRCDTSKAPSGTAGNMSEPREADEDCSEFTNKLRAGEPYLCQSEDPIGGQFTRVVAPDEDGFCLYAETRLQYSYELVCGLSQEQREAIADYYELPDAVHQLKFSIKNIQPDGTADAVEIRDGKEVTNPLQAALNQGACRVQSLDPSLLAAQTQQDGNADAIRRAVLDKITEDVIDVVALPHSNLDKFFPSWEFYGLAWTVNAPEDWSPTNFLSKVAVENNALLVLFFDKPFSDDELPEITTIARDDSVQLKNKSDVEQFGIVLQMLLFEEFQVEADSLGAGKWAVCTGEFFDHKKGYLITLDDNGYVQDVEYKLKLKK